MEWLKRLFKAAQPTTTDPMLGEMRWENSAWCCPCRFAPTDGEIALCIESHRAPLSEAQRQFFREIERRYPDLLRPLGNTLFTTLAVEGRQGRRRPISPQQRGQLWDHCILEGITLNDADTLQCDFFFYCDWTEDHYALHMREWEVTEVEPIDW